MLYYIADIVNVFCTMLLKLGYSGFTLSKLRMMKTDKIMQGTSVLIMCVRSESRYEIAVAVVYV